MTGRGGRGAAAVRGAKRKRRGARSGAWLRKYARRKKAVPAFSRRSSPSGTPIYPSIRRGGGQGVVATIYHHPRFPYFSSTRASGQAGRQARTRARTHAHTRVVEETAPMVEGEERRRRRRRRVEEKRTTVSYSRSRLAKARDFYAFG